MGRAARAGRAASRASRALAIAAVAALPAAGTVGCGGAADGEPPVRPGIDVLLADSAHLLEGLRVGLITHQSGVSRDGTSSIDRLEGATEVELAALFAPEHSIRGDAGEGVPIEDERDAATGLPVHSLYGGTRAPTPAMLEGLDALLFDLQDIGARYYTYISTMAFAMRAAGEAGLPFVVLDRPNPIGGRLVQGPVLDPAFSTFVGLYPIPVRHGMTAGELARLFRGAFGVDVELHVVPADGWRREMWLDETGLPWIPPSRNMPSLESGAHYPGTCLFEGTGLSVGRGTPLAFQVLGAPGLDGERWARDLAAYDLPGVRIEPVSFTPHHPTDGKYDGVEVSGIRLAVIDRDRYDPVVTAVAALREARRLAGGAWQWNVAHFDRLAGSDRLRLAIERGDEVAAIVDGWEDDLAAFAELRTPYLLYP